MQCSYKTVDVVMSCYTGEHNSGNRSSWSQCQWKIAPDGFPPQQYTVTALVCGDDLTTDVGTYPGEGGGDSGYPGAGTGEPGIPTQPVEISSFPIFVKNLQPDLKAIINAPENEEFYNVFLKYYNLSYESTESKEMIKWGLKVKQNNSLTTIDQILPMLTFAEIFFPANPDTTFAQFQDWFLDEPILDNTLQNELFEDWADINRVKPTTKFKKHAKLNSIYNKIKTSANFNEYLKNFESNFSVAHLVFDINSITKVDALAETTEPINYFIKITFNKDKDWNNIPKVVVAGTFMHEMIHAEMFRKLLSINSTPNGNIDWDLVKSLNTEHNYPGLYDYYVRSMSGDTNSHHEAMAAHYVNIMVNFLKQVYGNQYTDIEYKSIIWMSSLKGTRAWNLLSQSQKNLYETTFNNNYWNWEM
ncbi:hypothetical protein LPB85_10940 [Chryseobacterium sp. LC2016-27]|uniref:hypothetical protein n=1 Tax=Chryseobacterium sp. LC2016-27 TaxID=2897326 RepID=UPI001E41CC0B|nr:hypothetical protein [Chryseobacterium sp. LC2016-27]MCD0455950.1 hypothetical protein [Chryseobacterium sp. LC2016-27]